MEEGRIMEESSRVLVRMDKRKKRYMKSKGEKRGGKGRKMMGCLQFTHNTPTMRKTVRREFFRLIALTGVIMSGVYDCPFSDTTKCGGL